MRSKNNKVLVSFFRLELVSVLLVLSVTFALPIILNGMSPCYAGTYIHAGESNGVDVISHPMGYTGTAGVMTVGICIDPTSVNAADIEVSVQNIIDTLNNMTVTTANVKLGTDNNVPVSFIDFESVALHELGHCLGLGHVNSSTESGLTGNGKNYTKATDGADDVLNVAFGNDGIVGTRDDIRGDDINLHWSNKASNDPFQIDYPVDSVTYSRKIGDFPAGDNFAANASRSLAAVLGVPNSEAIMQQGTLSDEAQRTLVADGVATLRYAMSGLDETANTADDYTINLLYRGITTTGCDITINFDNAATGFAQCRTIGSQYIGGTDHVVIGSAVATFNDSFKWFFNDIRNNLADMRPLVVVFPDQTDVALSELITSASMTVSGISHATPIIVAGGEYSVNGGVFTSATNTVNNGDLVAVRHTAAANFSTSTTSTLSIGEINGQFTSTTQMASASVSNSSGGGGSVHPLVILLLVCFHFFGINCFRLRPQATAMSF